VDGKEHKKTEKQINKYIYIYIQRTTSTATNINFKCNTVIIERQTRRFLSDHWSFLKKNDIDKALDGNENLGVITVNNSRPTSMIQKDCGMKLPPNWCILINYTETAISSIGSSSPFFRIQWNDSSLIAIDLIKFNKCE